jgi:uncharacterized C2H2 Zn-finger protein
MSYNECNKCNQIFNNKWNYIRHINTCMKNDIYNNKDIINNEYICDKCNKIFNYKSHYQRHVNKKFSCIKDVKINNEIQNDKMILINDFQCNDCQKNFTTKRSLDRHHKLYCNKSKGTGLYQIIEKLQNEVAELKIYKNDTNINNIINSYNNSNNTINNNITINAYGKEDLSHMTDKDYKKIFNKCNSAIPLFIEMVHFNENKPENTNMYISNIKSRFAYIYNGKQWNLMNKDELIDDIYDKKCIILLEKYEDLKDILNDQTIKNFNHFIEKYDSDTMKENVLNRIELLLYNNRIFAKNK